VGPFTFGVFFRRLDSREGIRLSRIDRLLDRLTLLPLLCESEELPPPCCPESPDSLVEADGASGRIIGFRRDPPGGCSVEGLMSGGAVSIQGATLRRSWCFLYLCTHLFSFGPCLK